MEHTLDLKIYYLNSFFNFFYLNKENFSKSIQLQLNLLKPLLKFDTNLLSSIEKEKLIFVQSENVNNVIKNNNEENKNFLRYIKNLDLLYSIVKRFNMDLKYNKEKMINNYKSNEIEFEKKLNDINFDNLLKKFEEQFGNIIKNNKYSDNNFIKSQELIKNKNDILHHKNEILDISKKNEEINLKLYDLKKKLDNYKDLPSEINQMKNLVAIKKEEYKTLLIGKK